MNNLLFTAYFRNQLESSKDDDYVNTTVLSTYSNSDQLEHPKSHEQQQSKVGIFKKSMYNHSIGNLSSDHDSLDYSAVIDDQVNFVHLRVCIIVKLLYL